MSPSVPGTKKAHSAPGSGTLSRPVGGAYTMTEAAPPSATKV